MISTKMSATQWLASACRDVVRLVDALAKLRQEKSARVQAAAAPVYAHFGAGVVSAPAPSTGAAAPTQQITKGGMRGPQPWRDAPVIT
ncbi:hypothetical protein ACGF0J_17000 [Nonomuraea sp. NPDC047897]|uniref:hypothetical protein n=1 Tax=Nonomuraea sp. NPDC047897 TaxID=3364346 RepID=UPI003718AA87